ncbi:hypothetical protein Mal15_14180 [Stieleria maiorica]|uniref:Uncharacterized protein n=1 Tax=Stieleria maiorica TaxID=2795974 RepID=A0A5B9M857_9BACT|nr:hypothetical protein [Stieleria maiorica]QEF97378.1 hypothetical protein Mal15_14180 [Stieleria maiorica]
MTAQLVDTPYYVLLDGKQRLGPKLLRPHLGPEGVAIYGFSDKPTYDLFCANSNLALTPYPLVKGYLKNQITDSGNAIHLIVVDAEGPNETQLNATTMKSVLTAQEQESERVTISFHLMLDPGSQAYRVENASSDLGVTNSPKESQRG